MPKPTELAVGAHVWDARTWRTGVVQLLRDGHGNVCATSIQRPTRALLRAVGRREPLWWARVADLSDPAEPPADDAQGLGLGHVSHPLIGQRVVDTATGRTGTLRAICPESDDAPPVAWLSPPGGGREWTTATEAIEGPPTGESGRQ
ncbi:hypothetical protein [Streptomyces mayteni]